MQNNFIITVAGWIIGIVGALIALCGGLAGYIFTRHVRDNDKQFDENREAHTEIFRRLNERRR